MFNENTKRLRYELKATFDIVERTLNYGTLDTDSRSDLEKLLTRVSIALAETNDNYDPTPWCNGCRSKTKGGCNCGPIADNE